MVEGTDQFRPNNKPVGGKGTASLNSRKGKRWQEGREAMRKRMFKLCDDREPPQPFIYGGKGVAD
jgi:hypothetical protein